MGQTLSEPIVEKHTSSGGDKRIIWAASEMQGWRISMICEEAFERVFLITLFLPNPTQPNLLLTLQLNQ